jgi:hypothetical protein
MGDLKMTDTYANERDGRYQGWKNWETWNVALWLGNDEPLYRACIRDARFVEQGEEIDALQAEHIVRALLPNGTPDFQSEHHGNSQGAALFSKVDWQEIADDINEMAGLEKPRD